ncbi:MAG: hypothetical protein PVJ55_06485 [Anaerolineae bacterium]|jgi:hypothetical protein
MDSERELRAQVDHWAEWIESRGLSSVALPLLDVGDTFAFLVAQALLVAEPFVQDLPDGGLEQAKHLVRSPGLRRQLKDRLLSRNSGHE